MEVIIRQMSSRVRVLDPGDSGMVMNEIIESSHAISINRKLEEEGKELAKLNHLVLGITEVSLNRRSFLSAASFQHTTRTLIQASLRGTVDRLEGLKENVIIGRLIPAGTGFKGSKKAERIRIFQEERTKKLDALMAEEEAREKIADVA